MRYFFRLSLDNKIDESVSTQLLRLDSLNIFFLRIITGVLLIDITLKKKRKAIIFVSLSSSLNK